jgi:hypothetical protein
MREELFRHRKSKPSAAKSRRAVELVRTFAEACERDDFRLAHYSIQGNHAHLIVEADDERALGRGMKAGG